MHLDRVPRFRLARTPTPLHEARRLRQALGGPGRCPRILLKRDDLTDLALGGNKARKLEYLVADARRQGATVLVTTGGLQSNHARMTAAAARIAGMGAALVLSGGRPARLEGNLLLGRILGAELHFVDVPYDRPAELAEAETAVLAEVMAGLVGRGERPYRVALGGSDGLGALGYVEMTRELVSQLADRNDAPGRLYHASGSRGTQAGLELGARVFAASWRVTGIAVSPGGAAKRARAAELIRDAAARIGVDVAVDADALETDESYYGAGYAAPTPGGIEAITLLARTEGVVLDPVYTGKAMAGLIDHVRTGRVMPDETVVFVHTGGAPGLFGMADAFAG
jgi:D-cysteine desulfhydrase family pyridoxal phosphate-dependent enzyme